MKNKFMPWLTRDSPIHIVELNFSNPSINKREYSSAVEMSRKVYTSPKWSSECGHSTKMRMWSSFRIAAIPDKSNCFTNHFLPSRNNHNYRESVKIAPLLLTFVT